MTLMIEVNGDNSKINNNSHNVKNNNNNNNDDNNNDDNSNDDKNNSNNMNLHYFENILRYKNFGFSNVFCLYLDML